MLVELTITDFAVIERTSIDFDRGLNVLSGETGAGKSILIDALGAALGERVSTDVVRSGARVARVDAVFDLDAGGYDAEVKMLLDGTGLATDEPLLILSREVHATGRSIARVNGHPTTVATLAMLGERLVDIHGQSEHLSLLRPVAQLDLLDRYTGTMPLRAEVSRRLRAWRDQVTRIDAITSGARERAQRVDLLTFQTREIEQAALVPGELDVLERDRQVLTHAERLRFDALSALSVISGDEAGGDATGALSQVRAANKLLAGMVAIDPAAGAVAERTAEVLVLLEELPAELRTYAEGIEADPARLATIEDRIELIRTLVRKYGGSIEEIMTYGEQASRELQELTRDEDDIDELRARSDDDARALGQLAYELSCRRQQAAAQLSAAMVQSIAALNMGRADVQIELAQRPAAAGIPLPAGAGSQTVVCDDTGIDQIRFLLAPNVGESLKPLHRIASGGETARLMLALKSILSDVDSTPTLVFDEIDVGVGGRSGQVVGEKLSELSSRHQVLVITHLAQIAAFGDAHFRIAKSEANGRVVSAVAPLAEGDRIEELAAMLGGAPVTDAARANGAELWRRTASWRRRQVAPPIASGRGAA